jgi:hypothetical protein
MRVRLHSGGETGTVTRRLGGHHATARVFVVWDSGKRGSWPAYALVALAPEPQDAS